MPDERRARCEIMALVLFEKLEDINPLAFKDQRHIAAALVFNAFLFGLLAERAAGLREAAWLVKYHSGIDMGLMTTTEIFTHIADEIEQRARALEGEV